MAPLLQRERKVTSDPKSYWASPDTSTQYLSTFIKTNNKDYLKHSWKHPAVSLHPRTCLWIHLSVLSHRYSVLGHRHARKEGTFALRPAVRRRSWCFRRKHVISSVWWGKPLIKSKFLHAQNRRCIFCCFDLEFDCTFLFLVPCHLHYCWRRFT